MAEAHRLAALRRWRRERALGRASKAKPATRPYKSKSVVVKKASLDRLKRLVARL